MIANFGALDGSHTVQAVTLGHADGLQAEVLTYGGILRRLTLPGRDSRIDLILSLPDLATYVRDPAYLGILVGRVGNRIANSQFDLGGRNYRVSPNESPNHLHGGHLGFGKRLWKILDSQTSARHQLRLGLVSPANEEGYPGRLEVTAEVTVDAEEMRLQFEASASEATPLNLTYHPYFNLSGDPGRPLTDHELRMPAAAYLPVQSAALIPTGEIAPVTGTPFDFRSARTFDAPDLASRAQLEKAAGYDHCWVLDAGRDCDAELHSARSGVTMTVHSDRPGLQFYGGQKLHGAHPGLHGICLEPQGLPNAVNEPAFPSCILRPGETFRSLFTYRFKVAR